MDEWGLRLAVEAQAALEREFAGLPAFVGAVDDVAAASVLNELAGRMGENYPYFHPLYAGQMLKPPHPVARAAYALAMGINPNNHALDGGRATSKMEVEAVAALAQLFDYKEHLGHLTSGGTFANLEALWVAGQVSAGRVVASEQAHYTHARISGVLGLEFASVPTDGRGRMCLKALELELAQGGVGTVVVTLGTTALGAVDPLSGVLELSRKYGFRVHVDAAYGGYFKLAQNVDNKEFRLIGEADSIVVDPHKHGLQPYGCGCVLFKDPSVGRFYKHDSPYTYFSSKELHLGEISLECSRAGASAAALWVTQRMFPMVAGGEFAKGLEAGREAAVDLFQRLAGDSRFVAKLEPELDIVVWAVCGASIEESSKRAQAIFDAAAKRDLHLALVTVNAGLVMGQSVDNVEQRLVCLRSVLMKPEHREWMDEIWSRLDAATDEVLAGG